MTVIDHDRPTPLELVDDAPHPAEPTTTSAPLATDALLAAPGRRGRVPAAGARAARAVAHRALGALEGGTLVIREDGREHTFRSRRPDRYGRGDLHALVEVRDPRFYTAAIARGSSGLGEAYRQGWFETDDLTSFLRLLARLVRRTDPTRQRLHSVGAPVLDPIRRLRRPDADRDRRHIAAHYDLGNAFFELFLDETLTYSSGLFEHPGQAMADASRAKLDRLCRRLDLRPGQRVVEIGTGWGSFAMHAAREHGVHVVTTTLSVEQHRAAVRRVADAGLADRVEVRLGHYRDLTGTFDALVAVEMIEAVDWRELDDFMAHCARLVGPAGAVALQAIVTAPARQAIARTSNDFIKTHVFPGSSIPSVPSILEAAMRTDLMPVDLLDFGLHYAETLRRWRSQLARREADAVLALGLDVAFLRLWAFYLSYCEAGFEDRWVSVAQLVLERPGRTPSLQPTPRPT